MTVYFVTINTKDRISLFEQTEIVSLFANELIKQANSKKFLLLAFVIMPEHIHILLDCDRAQLPKIIKEYKSITYHLLSMEFNIKDKFWQSSFYTAEKNSVQEIVTTIEYIKNNPLKADLPLKYNEYPHMYINNLEASRRAGR